MGLGMERVRFFKRGFPEATIPGFLGFRLAPPPPLRGFPEATINVYTWIFLGFRIAPRMTGAWHGKME